MVSWVFVYDLNVIKVMVMNMNRGGVFWRRFLFGWASYGLITSMVTLSCSSCGCRGWPKIRLMRILSSSWCDRSLLLTQLTLIQIISWSCITIWSPAWFRIYVINFDFDFLYWDHSFFTHLTISSWCRKYRFEFINTLLRL